MRMFGRFLGRLIGFIIVIGVALWAFGPYEPVDVAASFDAATLAPDVDTYLARVESQVADIQDGAQKRVVWAADAGAKTPLSVVYFHGYSASSQEIRPVPQRVAAALGANLVFTRFTGHGIVNGGDALAAATINDWMNDAAEALAVANAVGDRVIILSTSTGGTIAAESLLQAMGENVAAVVFISPNFEINDPLAFMLTWPAARYWLPLIAGAEITNTAKNDAHARFWTLKYPTTAVMALGALVKHAAALDYATVKVPALFYYSDDDQVVVPQATDKIREIWGGATTRATPEMGAGDDPNAHVISGDIRSPSTTETTIATILAWLDGVL